MSVRLAVYKQDGVTLITHLPKRRGVQWLHEVNASGTGQFAVHLQDPLLAEHPDLLDEFNIVKISLDGLYVKAWVVEDVNPVRVATGEGADMWVTVSGRGVLSVLEAGVVYPEFGLRELTSEDRYFNFASRRGAWYVDTDWATPVGVKWSADTAAGRAGQPKPWTDKDAYWLWSTDPLVNAPAGPNWFRTEFSVDHPTPVVIYATGDNEIELHLDGEKIISSGTNTTAFRSRYEWRTTLATGEHVLGAVVTNLASTTSNPAGYIFSIYETNAAGEPTADVLIRSRPDNTVVKAYGDEPGWNGATVLQQVIVEAQQRGVTALIPITFSFTPTHDSAGVPWDTVDPFVDGAPDDTTASGEEKARIVKVGTTDIADLAQQIVELSMDLELDANFVLHAWKKRGSEIPGVRIVPNRDITSAAGTIRSGKLRNQALVKYEGGWVELFSATSKEQYGRREVGISLGTSGSVDQTIKAGTAVMREAAQPERTIPLSYTSVRGPQPYSDFNLGDTITIPDAYTGMTKARLMSIAGAEEDSGTVLWDLDFYPDTADDAISSVVVSTGATYDDDSKLYEEEVLSDSPWAFWRLDSAADPFKDYSGHLRTLPIVVAPSGAGEPAYNQAGPVDRSILFSHLITQYGVSSSGSRFFSEDATVECWVNIVQLPTGTDRATILGFANEYDSVTHDKELGINTNGTLYFYVSASNGQSYVTSAGALALNTWYHVVGSVGPQGQKLYINGVLMQSKPTITSSYNDTGQRVFLRGGGNGLNNQTIRCYIAEPAVYYQQLFDSRIKSHFDASGFTA